MTDNSLIWHPDHALPLAADLSVAPELRHLRLHAGAPPYSFLHEVSLESHRGHLYAAWNNSADDESAPGSVVRWVRSQTATEGWSEPRVLAPPLAAANRTWESAQFLSTPQGLYAFVGQVHTQPRTPEQAGGDTVIFRLNEDDLQWQVVGGISGFHPLNQPQRTVNGWVMGGQYNLVHPRVAVSDASNLLEWRCYAIGDEAHPAVDFAETSLAVGANSITAYVRNTSGQLLTSTADLDGRLWAPLVSSNLPASSSKTSAGVLSTGQRFLAYNMPPRPGDAPREALVLAVSAPGEELFRKLVALRLGPSPSPRLPGFAKGSQWCYPAVAEHAGQVCVGYTAAKEDAWLTRVPLDVLRV